MATQESPFQKFKNEKIDSVSPTFCGAKWLEGTIWLNSGVTASCHHTPTHHIDAEEIKTNPSALHNTPHKKRLRSQMRQGQRHSDCSYCWNLEDIGHTSDRIIKSFGYTPESLESVSHIDVGADVVPETLEIAFDRICQFSCMYCSPTYSTTWVQDIRSNGPYRNILSDLEEHYQHSTNSVNLVEDAEENPFVDAFWQWWPELSRKLRLLRVTGGEPLLSPNFWQLLEKLRSAPPKLELAVNSNLGVKTEIIQKFLKQTEGRTVDIYTSGEAFGKAAEYIRNGTNWDTWTKNVELVLSSQSVRMVSISFTLNNLSLFSMTQLLDQILKWKAVYGASKPTFFLNILRHPRFQSPLVLPEELKAMVYNDLEAWIKKNGDRVDSQELESIRRFADYLKTVESNTARFERPKDLEKDLKRFIDQYDLRRKRSYRDHFPDVVVDWLASI